MLLVWSSASGRLVEVNIAKEVLYIGFKFLFESISLCLPLAISISAGPTSPRVFASSRRLWRRKGILHRKSVDRNPSNQITRWTTI